MRVLSKILLFLLLVWAASGGGNPVRATASVSDDTEMCIACHASVTPGAVADWKKSRHAEEGAEEAVGCAECHCMNPGKHADSFEHNGYRVHMVVTTADCASCHEEEAGQYSRNIMSRAYGNLADNALYSDLVKSVNGPHVFDGVKISQRAQDGQTDFDSCFYCHGTKVRVTGRSTRDTVMGEMTFPVLSGWPNQGVGRVNPDGSLGSCASCHARHRFSIAMARKPYTCAECHKGPDVPAFKVYMVSKHGNMFSAEGDEWDFEAEPWTVGRDFTAPTCAVCHISRVETDEGEVVAERTHQMSDRLPWRIFGPLYAHAHPKSPDTSKIKNRAGLALPVELTGEPVSKFLIDADEQARRRSAMQAVCLSCHGSSWVEGHFTRMEHTIETTNEVTRASTALMLTAWERGAASGLDVGESIFDEAIEKKWVEGWLFFANSTRFASAMTGADYGVFANGRWALSRNVEEIADWLALQLKVKNHPEQIEKKGDGK
ncbi:multiheme c-type cytochrome [Thermodesulfobacteriota bacterium]